MTPPSALPPRLGIVTLGVDDLNRSVAFYSALGWRRASNSVDGVIAWFDCGGVSVGLFPRKELAADTGLAPETAIAHPFEGFTLAVNVADETAVEAGLQAIVDAGGRLVKPATHAEWGGYSGYGADPDGHLWEVAYNPGFPLTDGRPVIA